MKKENLMNGGKIAKKRMEMLFVYFIHKMNKIYYISIFPSVV